MSEADDLPRVLSGRYRLEATLGRGGMGVVYRGTDLMMKRPVAVKLIRAGDDLEDEAAGRFLREAKHTARLRHEHIIEVFDLGQTGSSLYFVMELLEGELLADRLRREGRLSPETTVHIGRQICDALEVAHTAGVIHRDLKPANIMLLSRAGDHEFVKVLDFGVAKSFGPNQQDETQLTHTGMLVGTVDYMAPEQISGKPVDGRTDVYALGVLLYRMLGGQPPFKDNGVASLIHAHLNTMPKPLMELASGVPNELDHVVLRCLAKNPERRFESMAELARALAHAVSPPSVGGMKVEHDSGGGGLSDATVTGRAVPEAPTPRPAAPFPRGRLPALADSTGNLRALDQDDFDTTVKLDRPAVAALVGVPPKPHSQIVPPRPLSKPPSRPRPARYSDDDEVTRVAQSSIPPGPPRPCAMCQTPNPPGARMCVACGLSLAAADQDAVRVRVRADVPQGAGGVPLPNATERVAFDATLLAPPASHPPMGHPYAAPTPAHAVQPAQTGAPFGDPQVGPWSAPPPPPQEPPPSMWRRFLVWAGLRAR